MSKTAKDLKPLINDLFLFGNGEFDEFSTADLFELLQAADDAYHNTQTPILSDEQYDALYLYCSTAEPDNNYFLGVGSQVRGGKIKLPYPMGSLTQAYLGGDVSKWVEKHTLGSETMLVTEKLDGQSSLIVYGANGDLQISYSRGDGYEGADTTRHTSKIVNLPKKVTSPMVVRSEIIFSKASFDAIKGTVKRSGGALYKNARNAISGIMNASEANDPLVYKFIDVVAYEILEPVGMSKTDQLELLKKLGFKTPNWFDTQGFKLTDTVLTKALQLLRDKSEYEIDGIVVDVNDATRRSQVNPSKNSLNPEFARKFKVADDSNLAIATVVEVQWNISKNGYLKPRVKIEPVELVGVTVQHATGFNAKFIKENGIGPGAKIRITRSGDVIPFIQGVVEATEPQMPEEDVEWTKTGVDLVLVNVDDNDTVKLEQLIDFFAKVGVEYLGEGNLQEIYNAGFETIVDVINLSEFEWTQMIGANGKKIHKSIREKLKNVPWYIVAGAHPAYGRGVGVRKMKKLYEAFEGDLKKVGDVNAILTVDGFEFKTASKIAGGHLQFIKFLTDTSATIIFAAYEAPKCGDLSGSTFLFTGFRSSDLEEQIVAQGGKISSSVSSKLTYLVAADPSETSGKLKKARDLGTKIITREELVELLG